MNDIIEAVYMVFVDKTGQDNRILMHKRTRGYGKGCYSPPGGHVDPEDVDHVACVTRETDEELGSDVKINPASMSLYHTQLRRSSDSDMLRINYYYMITEWTGTPVIAEPDKAEDLRYFPLNDLPYDEMMGDVCTAFQARLAGQDFSIDGFAAGDDTGLKWLAEKQAVTSVSTVFKPTLH